MISIKIDSRDGVSERMKAFVGGLTGAGRAELHEAIGKRAHVLTREHLGEIARTRHATAERLGASPTGHWAQAAEKTTFAATAENATVTINQVGIGRVAHDVEIRPGPGKQYLTIPMAAEAYGVRAYRLRDKGTFFLRSADGSHLFLARPDGPSGIKLLYSLVRSVRQKQDRTLLPSDEEYAVAVKEGTREYVGYLLSKSGDRKAETGKGGGR